MLVAGQAQLRRWPGVARGNLLAQTTLWKKMIPQRVRWLVVIDHGSTHQDAHGIIAAKSVSALMAQNMTPGATWNGSMQPKEVATVDL